MKIFFKIIQAILLITTPALMAYPINEIPKIIIEQTNHQTFQLPDLRTLSYDEVVNLLALIESDCFEDHYSADELDQINRFISFLAMEGVTDDEKIDMANATASLFRQNDIQYALFINPEYEYTATPAIYIQKPQDIVLCKSWFKKQWDQTKSFVKEHKKAIIIGAIVVVTVAVVVVAAVAISASAASTAAAGGLASAGSVAVSPEPKYVEKKHGESLVSSLQEQVFSFKETIAKEQFEAVSESNGISIEENGRLVGSLFAHKTVDTVTNYFNYNPLNINELKDFGFNSQCPAPKWLQTYPKNSTLAPHPSTDLAFSTDYTTTYATSRYDLNTLSYQARGDLALFSECYTQAVQDFGKAISLDPTNPILYLERGIANFELGNYENSIADYSQYVEKKGEPFSVTDFSLGFAKGVPKGAYESGKGTLLFLSDFIAHPIETSKQVVNSLNQLAILIKNDEFGVVAEALSPELYQLVTQWDTLPSETKGELAGYALGKVGTELLAPGAIAKVASKSVHSASELSTICKNIHIAQETLILETISGAGTPMKVCELVKMGKKAAATGEELGFSTQEIAQLQKTKKLNKTVAHAYKHLTPSQKQSFELFDNAQEFLKSYKGFMPESEVRQLIHQTGISTFPRPQGIPDNFRVQISDRGAGMKYIHPKHTHTSIRVMPGKPHSPFPYQQQPYVIHMKDGKCVDKFGNKIVKTGASETPEAHIPYNEFLYRD